MVLKKRTITIMATVSSVCLLSAVAYALGSTDFANRAKQWTDANCTNRLLNSRQNSDNNQKATICYNYLENQQQDQAISGLKSSPSPVFPVLVDANNNVLGTAADASGGIFYSKALSRYVDITYQSVPTVMSVPINAAARYTSTDCTGVTYLNFDSIRLNYDYLIHTYNNYYIVDPSSLPVTRTIHSELDGNGVCYTNGQASLPYDIPVTTATQVTLPFSLPIAGPVHVANL